jgi:hypothetical protein
VDAAVRLAANGDLTTEKLFSVIRDSTFAVALDEDDAPVVTPSPDDIPSLLVVTAPPHQRRVRTDKWQAMTAAELADLVIERSADILINPGAACSIRLVGEVFAQNLTAIPAP